MTRGSVCSILGLLVKSSMSCHLYEAESLAVTILPIWALCNSLSLLVGGLQVSSCSLSLMVAFTPSENVTYLCQCQYDRRQTCLISDFKTLWFISLVKLPPCSPVTPILSMNSAEILLETLTYVQLPSSFSITPALMG